VDWKVGDGTVGSWRRGKRKVEGTGSGEVESEGRNEDWEG